MNWVYVYNWFYGPELGVHKYIRGVYESDVNWVYISDWRINSRSAYYGDYTRKNKYFHGIF